MKAKVTRVKSAHTESASRPVICFIPGGPGISSATLRSMDLLSRSFDLAYVDPPGTGGLNEPVDPTFYSVTDAIEDELIAIGRPQVLCGHSFGALFGADLARRGRLNLAGFVAIGAPLSPEAYSVACDQYAKYMTPELRAAAESWDENPSRESLANLLASYGVLYFSPATTEHGKTLLESDQVSAALFSQVLPVLSKRTPNIDFVAMIRSMPLKKYMLAGAVDLMLPPETLRLDAQATGCTFREIAGAGHFVTFDQPEAVAGMIEELFSTAKRK